ncbi:TIGR04283 family arsenosugar biosynthesis glycosyltransferase [Thioalkalivibrio sp. ALJ7]|uniref:TIGR04283 family arsenosugar biosynthesis glycosyltransferase n=1 Tax=Thioalkalivibrio sp. ALJ7 TaxID=1158756 RepID=UPI0009DA95AE|nr:TIGR04283 family arsenosugar biosynthesis glycosyltransferase [Thioalkalivibrio sp. ALJ7]
MVTDGTDLQGGCRVSCVIPALNEAPSILATLGLLQPMRDRGTEVLLVDGGSRDGTPERAHPLVDRVLTAAPGRASQMNAGAAHAQGEILWFLHADTEPSPEADQAIRGAIEDGADWGYFSVRLSGERRLFRMVERMMTARSRMTGIATGDQGIFVRRALFEQVGGFPEQPLMEDVALSVRLKRAAERRVCLPSRLITSSRRWEERGAVRVILLMWWLRLAYALGVAPERLARWYR